MIKKSVFLECQYDHETSLTSRKPLEPQPDSCTWPSRLAVSAWPWIDSLISLSLTYLFCETATVLSPRIGVGIESESIRVQSNVCT